MQMFSAGNELKEIAYDLLALLWPCVCVVCGAADRELCTACKTALREREGEWARVSTPAGVDAFVAGPYAGPLRALLVSFKHAGRIGFGRVLGAQLRAPLRAALSANAHLGSREPPVLVVTVPSRGSRVRERGYRHVDVLLRGALRCRGPGDPRLAVFLARALRATRGRTSQVGLSAGDRMRNAARISVRRSAQALMSGRKVVLVDDVITTGATIAGAVHALSEAGANVVAVVALCATERRDARFASGKTLSENSPELGVELDRESAIGFVKGVKVRSTIGPPA